MRVFRKLLFCIAFSRTFSLLQADSLQFSIQGEAAILVNAETGHVLFEKEAYTPHFPASTTKIATALYALEKSGHLLNSIVTVKQEAIVSITPDAKRKSNYTTSSHWLETDGTHIGLKKDEEMSFHDLLRGMLITSGNDAANVIAQFVQGDIDHFVLEMNKFLSSLGCHHTTFYNTHGLHHPQHQTTAYDLSLIARRALKSSIFCDIVSQPRFTRPKTNKQKSITLLSSNRLLRPGKLNYPKAIGIKTGYHSKSKHTFVGAARAGGRTLIIVLLAYPNRQQLFEDAIKLFDLAFNQSKIRKTFLKEGKQKFTLDLPRGHMPLQTYLKNPVSIDYYPAEEPQVKCLLSWNLLALPIQKDEQVGLLKIINTKGDILQTFPLFALSDIEWRWPHSWWYRIKQEKIHHPIAFFLGLGTILLLLLGGSITFFNTRKTH